MDTPTVIPDTPPEQPASILLVDDRPENLELLVQILNKAGYTTRPALSAQLALGAVACTQLDLILLDIRMPEMDGFELCRRLKAGVNTRDIPIIFISALEDIDEKITAFQNGGVDYITRPFQKEEVLARVRTHLELSQMRRHMEALVQQRTRQLHNKTRLLEREIKARQAATEKLKTSEQNYRFIVENIHEVFWIGSPDWNEIHYISPAYETVWGRSCKSLYAAPRSWLEAVRAHDRDNIVQALTQVNTNADAVILFPDFRILKPDGMLRWIRARAFPIKNANGEAFRIVGIAEDITQEFEVEEKRRQTHKMEAIGTLAGGIAHDFNNLLGIILGNTELALDDLPSRHAAQGNLNEIKIASLRARDVIKQLLDLSQNSDLHRRPLDVGIIVKEMLKLIRTSLPAAITIREEIAEDSHTVMADQGQLRQLIIILATNASTAMRDKGGTLTVVLNRKHIDGAESRRYSELTPGPHVVVTISDTGEGIAPEIEDKIFDPYFTTLDIGEGSGMGLAVAHGIVKNHGGTIEVESTLGEGSTFRIFLPDAKALAGQVEPAEAESIPTGDEKVLFIDDEQAITKAAQTSLERLGYHVTIANDPSKALGLFLANPYRFDLVITDMTMPNMSGDALAKEILFARADIPIIICTGHSEHLNEQKALEIGIRHYAEKPLGRGELAHLIRNALDHREN